ncbi:hypothetical protein ACFLZ7_00450 [Nanoarchaeota archaeon]
MAEDKYLTDAKKIIEVFKRIEPRYSKLDVNDFAGILKENPKGVYQTFMFFVEKGGITTEGETKRSTDEIISVLEEAKAKAKENGEPLSGDLVEITEKYLTRSGTDQVAALEDAAYGLYEGAIEYLALKNKTPKKTSKGKSAGSPYEAFRIALNQAEAKLAGIVDSLGPHDEKGYDKDKATGALPKVNTLLKPYSQHGMIQVLRADYLEKMQDNDPNQKLAKAAYSRLSVRANQLKEDLEKPKRQKHGSGPIHYVGERFDQMRSHPVMGTLELLTAAAVLTAGTVAGIQIYKGGLDLSFLQGTSKVNAGIALVCGEEPVTVGSEGIETSAKRIKVVGAVNLDNGELLDNARVTHKGKDVTGEQVPIKGSGVYKFGVSQNVGEGELDITVARTERPKPKDTPRPRNTPKPRATPKPKATAKPAPTKVEYVPPTQTPVPPTAVPTKAPVVEEYNEIEQEDIPL